MTLSPRVGIYPDPHKAVPLKRPLIVVGAPVSLKRPRLGAPIRALCILHSDVAIACRIEVRARSSFMRAIAFVVSRSKKRSSSPLRRPHSDRRNALRFVRTYEIDLIEERPWRSNMTVDEWPSKKARKMNRIDRRFSVAPMMDCTTNSF